MGLYDTIIDKLFCPFCGKLQEKNSFQTKNLGKNMASWLIKEIKKYKTRKLIDETKIYTTCNFCKNWIELIIKGEKKD